MAIETFERAQQSFKRLQSCADFEHFGNDSRGIRIQTDSLLKGIAVLSIERPNLQHPLILMSALIATVSEDYGTYVAVKGSQNWIGFDIRGVTGSFDGRSTIEELRKVGLRRSGVNVDVTSNGRSSISAHSDFLEAEGQRVADVINLSLERLAETEREELAHQFVNIVTLEIAQSGEFLDL